MRRCRQAPISTSHTGAPVNPKPQPGVRLTLVGILAPGIAEGCDRKRNVMMALLSFLPFWVREMCSSRTTRCCGPRGDFLVFLLVSAYRPFSLPRSRPVFVWLRSPLFPLAMLRLAPVLLPVLFRLTPPTPSDKIHLTPDESCFLFEQEGLDPQPTRSVHPIPPARQRGRHPIPGAPCAT